MDITKQISELIMKVKNAPNSLAKNKAISALENARVWSVELNYQEASHNSCGFNCADGMIAKGCPVHDKLINS